MLDVQQDANKLNINCRDLLIVPRLHAWLSYVRDINARVAPSVCGEHMIYDAMAVYIADMYKMTPNGNCVDLFENTNRVRRNGGTKDGHENSKEARLHVPLS